MQAHSGGSDRARSKDGAAQAAFHIQRTAPIHPPINDGRLPWVAAPKAAIAGWHHINVPIEDQAAPAAVSAKHTHHPQCPLARHFPTTGGVGVQLRQIDLPAIDRHPLFSQQRSNVFLRFVFGSGAVKARDADQRGQRL